MNRLIAIWNYRDFIRSMVWREFKGRYLGTVLGSIWSIINPLVMIFIYTVIFSRIMRARLPGVDDSMGYGIYLCSGLLMWNFYAELMSRFPNIFIEWAPLLKKLNFPRTTLPIIVLFSSIINFCIIFTLFLLFLIIINRFPGWIILCIIPVLIIQQMFVMGLGIFLGTLNVFFRDISQLVGVILQFWFWFTPIVYPLNILPDHIRIIIERNPMTHFITAYQDIILYGTMPDWGLFMKHAIVAVLALLIGLFVFNRLSNEIVDEL